MKNTWVRPWKRKFIATHGNNGAPPPKRPLHRHTHSVQLQSPLSPHSKNAQPLDGQDPSQARIDTFMGEARVSPSFLAGSKPGCLQTRGVWTAPPARTELRCRNFCLRRLILCPDCWQTPESCNRTPSLISFRGSHPNFVINILHLLYELESRRCKELRALRFWDRQWVLQPPRRVAAPH